MGIQPLNDEEKGKKKMMYKSHGRIHHLLSLNDENIPS